MHYWRHAIDQQCSATKCTFYWHGSTNSITEQFNGYRCVSCYQCTVLWCVCMCEVTFYGHNWLLSMLRLCKCTCRAGFLFVVLQSALPNYVLQWMCVVNPGSNVPFWHTWHAANGSRCVHNLTLVFAWFVPVLSVKWLWKDAVFCAHFPHFCWQFLAFWRTVCGHFLNLFCTRGDALGKHCAVFAKWPYMKQHKWPRNACFCTNTATCHFAHFMALFYQFVPALLGIVVCLLCNYCIATCCCRSP